LIDRVVSALLGIALAVSLVAAVMLTIKNTHLTHELGEANKKIAGLEVSSGTLASAMQSQNDAIDSAANAAEVASEASEKAMEDLLPFVDEEERRILGIRGAQQFSVLADPSERLEHIRKKMLQDATL
jgi:hypothetical protein